MLFYEEFALIAIHIFLAYFFFEFHESPLKVQFPLGSVFDDLFEILVVIYTWRPILWLFNLFLFDAVKVARIIFVDHVVLNFGVQFCYFVPQSDFLLCWGKLRYLGMQLFQAVTRLEIGS